MGISVILPREEITSHGRISLLRREERKARKRKEERGKKNVGKLRRSGIMIDEQLIIGEPQRGDIGWMWIGHPER